MQTAQERRMCTLVLTQDNGHAFVETLENAREVRREMTPQYSSNTHANSTDRWSVCTEGPGGQVSS